MNKHLDAISLATFALLAMATSACSTRQPIGPPNAADAGGTGDVIAMSGAIEAIDNGCFADGECSVTVDGLKIVTMRGWSRATWGPRDPELAVGERVDVRCRRIAIGCTLENDRGLFIKSSR